MGHTKLNLGLLSGLGLAAAGVGLWLLFRRSVQRGAFTTLEVYELNGNFYQMLGHAWDHETKQFKVIYRPLYHCGASNNFEAHVLASSHFSRWESKFRKVEDVGRDLSQEAKEYLLPGPFVKDPEWTRWSTLTQPLNLPAHSSPLLRSHEALKLEHVIGNVEAFVEAIHAQLLDSGFDPIVLGYEMDHVCFRTETVEEYQAICGALVPRFGHLMVEGMVGKRPITTVDLYKPICTPSGYSVRCLEIPSPKPGRFYASGLEHCEIVVGKASDGVTGNKLLKEFMDKHAASFKFDTRALNKSINADIAIFFDIDEDFSLHRRAKTTKKTRVSVKFHQRPLYEVCTYEKKHDCIEPVPEGYFSKQEKKE